MTLPVYLFSLKFVQNRWKHCKYSCFTLDVRGLRLWRPLVRIQSGVPCRDGDFDTTSIKISVPAFCLYWLKTVDSRTFLEKHRYRPKRFTVCGGAFLLFPGLLVFVCVEILKKGVKLSGLGWQKSRFPLNLWRGVKTSSASIQTKISLRSQIFLAILY